VVSAQSKQGDNDSPQALRTIEGISEYRLDNGLQLLLFPDPSKPTVTVNMTVFVGSRHEGYGEAGMAHLLEHMLFKGTTKNPAIPKVLQDRGANFNGTTWLDRTNYFETLPASDENLAFAIELEADRLMNSLIRGEDLASEMTVVRNEFESGENSPEMILSQRMMAAAFEWHNYGRATIGNRADIERVPLPKLREFYRKYYQPDNVMLVIAGQFETDAALKLVLEHFGSLPKPARQLDTTYTEEPAQDGERVVTLQRVGKVPVVGAMYHVPSGGHPDFAPIAVLDSVLTAMPTGRLYKGLVEKKKAASVSSAAWALHDPGILQFSAEIAGGSDPQAVLGELTQIVESVGAEGVTPEEVERARQKLLKQRELDAADSAKLAIELSEWAAMGDWRLYFLFRDRLEKVAPSDLQRVAAEYLVPHNRTVGKFLPVETPTRANIPATPSFTEMIGDYRGRGEVEVGEAFDVKPEAIEARTKRTKLSSGLQLALLPKKTRGEAVTLVLTLRYGNEENLKNIGKAADYLPRLMTLGTRQLDRQQLEEAWDQHRAEVNATGQPGELTIAIKTKRKSLPDVLDLLRQVLREPSLPESELELLRQGDLARLTQALDDPQMLATRAVNRRLNPYPAEDPRHVPTLADEIELMKKLTIRDVRQLYERYLSGSHGELSVVGDFDGEEITPMLDRLFAGWKSERPFARLTRSGSVPYKPSAETIKTPDKANATYFAGMAFAMRDDHPDFPALLLGNFILGGGSGLSSRLGDRVREQEGLSYGVGSGLRSSSVDARTTFYVFAIANPQNMDKLKAVIREEHERLLKEGVTDEELAAAKQGFLQQMEVDRTNDAGLAQELNDSLLARRTLKFDADLEARLRDTTTAQVLAAVKKYLSPDRMILVIAGDL
ncbi:MAG: Protease 3 precursor, partial [Planctomycetota bacterium]